MESSLTDDAGVVIGAGVRVENCLSCCAQQERSCCESEIHLAQPLKNRKRVSVYVRKKSVEKETGCETGIR